MRQLTILGTAKSIIQKATNPEILVYTDDVDLTQKSADITGDKKIKYKHKVEIDGKVVKEYGDFGYGDTMGSVSLEDLISPVKSGEKKSIATITALQDDGIVVTESSNINIYSQRNYSLQFDGTANQYVSITVPTGFTLADKTVQVLVKPNGGSWSMRTDSGVFVILSGTELCIGKSQNCIIDEVRIWLTASVKPYLAKPLKGNNTGLIAYYRFNEFDGTNVYDNSNNGYHGVINGSAKFINDRYLEQNVIDAIITNDINNVTTVLPKNSIHNYKVNIERPQMPSAIILETNKTEKVFGVGKLIEYDISKEDWEKINGVGIIESRDGQFVSQIVGNKKSLYDYDVKISEIGYSLKNSVSVSYDTINENISVDTNNFKQAVSSYTNKITVYEEGGFETSKENKFLLYNREPTLILGLVDAMNLFLQVGDADGDKVKFRIELNGKKFYPSTSDYTELQTTPVIFTKLLGSKEVLVGATNIMKVYTKDEYEVESSHIINFTGEYCGLMFTDETGSYYSSDLGDIIKRLDFGIITAGQTSKIAKVYLKNTTGYSVSNIKISLDVSTIPKNNIVKISSQPEPFDSVDSISYPNTLGNGEQVPFFVRVKTQVLGGNDGTFVINATGIPV
ncbi:hypothetical protein [Clostridium tagluense]|uniref:Uncharacterized protein n=1 Tax=Clostridium tagluense TaxID=360422 RepID=A0A401UQJ2_9CLOT|nr:hypothetical protein [Clostridium tagluense]GCD11781.1 hypothetical protein Ctaglu_34040 [Clostridium tagluense]